MTSNRVYMLFSLIAALALVTAGVLATAVLNQPRASSPAGSTGLDQLEQLLDKPNSTTARERADAAAAARWAGLASQYQPVYDPARVEAAAAARWTGLASQYGPVYDADRANSAYGGRWQGLAQSYLAGASSH